MKLRCMKGERASRLAVLNPWLMEKPQPGEEELIRVVVRVTRCDHAGVPKSLNLRGAR
jgi:hypothetical protein